MLLRSFSFLCVFSLTACDCVNEEHFEGYAVDILDGEETPEDEAGSLGGEVQVRLGDMSYDFHHAIDVARGKVPVGAPFTIGIAHWPRNGPVGGYESCTVQVDEAPISDIESTSGGEDLKFTIQLDGDRMRALCLEYWERRGQEPNTNIDETWDDWIDLLPFNDVNLYLKAEYYNYTTREACE